MLFINADFEAASGGFCYFCCCFCRRSFDVVCLLQQLLRDSRNALSRGVSPATPADTSGLDEKRDEINKQWTTESNIGSNENQYTSYNPLELESFSTNTYKVEAPENATIEQ